MKLCVIAIFPSKCVMTDGNDDRHPVDVVSDLALFTKVTNY
jgi:hypothetical protein